MTGRGDQSIAYIIRLLLFPVSYENEKQYDFIQRQTHSVIDNFLKLIYSTISNKKGSQSNFFDQIHQIGIYFLGYIYHNLSTEILVGYRYITIPKDFQKQIIDSLFEKLLDFQFKLIKDNWLQKERGIYPIDRVLHSFQSLIIMDLFWSKRHNIRRGKIVESRIKKYFNSIKKDIKVLDMDSKERQALIQIGNYLANYKNLKNIGRIIRILSRRALLRDFNLHPRSFNKLKSIKRPILH